MVKPVEKEKVRLGDTVTESRYDGQRTYRILDMYADGNRLILTPIDSPDVVVKARYSESAGMYLVGSNPLMEGPCDY